MYIICTHITISYRERGNTLKNWELWYLNISQYEIYRHDDPIIDKLLHNLAMLPVTDSSE